MNTKQAKPGDTIKIVCPILGNDPDYDDVWDKEFVVLEPDQYTEDDEILIKHNKEYVYLKCHEYDICKDFDTKCPDCNGTGKITLLTSTVDCDCVSQSISQGPQYFPDDSPLKNAWYSKEKAAKHGTVTYLCATTGKEIVITEISSEPTPCSEHDDAKFVGIIDGHKYVRGGMN